jgi:hypothetical protein
MGKIIKMVQLRISELDQGSVFDPVQISWAMPNFFFFAAYSLQVAGGNDFATEAVLV